MDGRMCVTGYRRNHQFYEWAEAGYTSSKNAIKMGYNNGLAEGSVNKLKVVKRIMYVRNSFELLKAKLLQLELKRKVN